MALSASDIKFIRSLQQKKFRKESGCFVVEGVKPVRELLQSDFEIDALYASESLEHLGDVTRISEKELGRISGLATPNKVLAVVKTPTETKVHWENDLILFLDGIRDPGNLGTIIRTAKWFGINELICSVDCVDVYDRKVVQSTMGALFHVNIHYREPTEVLNQTKSLGYEIVGTAMEGESVFETTRTDKTLLVIGSESHGIRDEVLQACNRTFSIPNREVDRKIESLNAGVATAILLAELTRHSSK